MKNDKISLEKLNYQAQKAYVATMMKIIGNGLAAMSTRDEEARNELRNIRPGFVMQMTVFPSGPTFTLQVGENGSAKVLADAPGRPDLVIRFKHVSHAFQVFSFQEGTARAFANDRMVVDGSLGEAMIFVRCLNKMQQLILPKFIAQGVIKRYDKNLGLAEKLSKATRIYGEVFKNIIRG